MMGVADDMEVDHIAIRVKDMNRAIDYYLDLGFNLEWESPDL